MCSRFKQIPNADSAAIINFNITHATSHTPLARCLHARCLLAARVVAAFFDHVLQLMVMKSARVHAPTELPSKERIIAFTADMR